MGGRQLMAPATEGITDRRPPGKKVEPAGTGNGAVSLAEYQSLAFALADESWAVATNRRSFNRRDQIGDQARRCTFKR
jgi:hypothetical protein